MPDHVLKGFYDYPLVVLSVFISILAACAALDLAGRITSSRGNIRFAWMSGGALAMGTGIWSMHYVGMLAYHLPLTVRYDWPTVLLSLLAAIAASGGGLFIASRHSMGLVRSLVGSVFMGSGIAAMHYLGMEAMRLNAMCSYSPGLVIVSVALAIIISFVALRLTFTFREKAANWGWQKVLCALTMGTAIPVMHYVGMAAVDFVPSPMRNADLTHAVSISALGLISIVTITVISLGLVILTAVVDRHFSLQVTRSGKELRRSEEQFRQLAENIREVFWMMDVNPAKIIYVSPAYETIWGRTCQSLYADPHSWMHSIHPEDRAGAGEIFWRQVQGEILTNEYRIVQPSGDVRWIRDRAFPVCDGAGTIVRLAGVAEDTTERKQAEARLVHQSLYDELTDLPNRRLFRERLRQAIAACGPGQSGAVFFIDLDHFKLVNDSLGHIAGDHLLQQVVHRLLATCRESGTLARFGGDEFMLAASGFNELDSVRHLGERLIGCLDEPFRIADREVFIGASIGISLFPENGTDPYVLKRDADLAMHEAKRAGKNQIRFFRQVFADTARERLEMESRLQKALALSEFRLQFQPQFPAGRSRPSRFEALICWYPFGDQPVPPLKFIPVAEQNGLIIPIGKWALEEACRRCAHWQTGDLQGVGVAVNVSASQFTNPDFVEITAQALKSAGLAPYLLELEVTESVFIQEVKASARTLTKLRMLGITIALDDFGTGYSSLSYLQSLPLDALKIDRSFLMEAEKRREGASVLRCVVELAQTLGLRVVGEGIETTAQLHLLDSLGCDEFQGFLLGRPSFEVASTGCSNPNALYANMTETPCVTAISEQGGKEKTQHDNDKRLSPHCGAYVSSGKFSPERHHGRCGYSASPESGGSGSR